MPPRIVQHRTVLHFRFTDVVRGRVTFEQEDIEGQRSIHLFVMDRDRHLDLGEPQTITVTIQRGDLLNMGD